MPSPAFPAGLVFDADGTGSCPGTEPCEICGTPPPPTTLTSGTQTVAIDVTAQDANADANRAAGDDRDPLTLQVSALARPTLASQSVGGVSGERGHGKVHVGGRWCSRLPIVQAARQVAKQ